MADDDLERERNELLQRLTMLEQQHEALRDKPHEDEARAAHHQDLLNYQHDVRAYSRRYRRTDDPTS